MRSFTRNISRGTCSLRGTIASARPRDDAVDDLALPILVLVVDDLTLGAAHLLDDHLLGGLRRDASEAARVELHAHLVVELNLRVELARLAERDLRMRIRHRLDDRLELEQLDLAGVLVELRLDLTLLAELPASGGDERLLESLDHRLSSDALVLAHLIDDASKIQVHAYPLPTLFPARRRARRRRAGGPASPAAPSNG
jgi:hypothetical protein